MEPEYPDEDAFDSRSASPAPSLYSFNSSVDGRLLVFHPIRMLKEPYTKTVPNTAAECLREGTQQSE